MSQGCARIGVGAVGLRSWATIVAVAAIAACGGDPDDDTADTTTAADTTTTSTTGEETTTGTSESTGGLPEACPDVALETGIVGRTDVRTCEFLAECLTPTPGIPLAAYAENPQTGGDPSTPGTPTPGIEPVAELNSGVAGRYEFLLDSGTYFICAAPEFGSIVCSPPVTLSEDDPVVFVEYEEWTTTSWQIISCGL